LEEKMTEQKIELKMIRMSEIQSQDIGWLWYPFIPYGKLTIIQGDPGDGKTTMVLNLAAKLSKGEALDENMKVTEPVNVIYQTAEDGLADTVKPRLELAGADCERIIVIDESDKSLSMVDERLEEAHCKEIYGTHAPVCRFIAGSLIHMTDKDNCTLCFLIMRLLWMRCLEVLHQRQIKWSRQSKCYGNLRKHRMRF